MEPLEEKEKMPTLGTGKNNSGFTLIELLVVLILIGISSSYLMLNTNLVNIFNSSDDAPENFFQYMSDESILKGRTLHWFLTTNEEGIYMDEYLNDASFYDNVNESLVKSVRPHPDIDKPFAVLLPDNLSAGTHEIVVEVTEQGSPWENTRTVTLNVEIVEPVVEESTTE